MNVEKELSLGRALWNLVSALTGLLIPVVLLGFAVWAYFQGQYESVHHLLALVFLIMIMGQVAMLRKLVERIEKQQKETRVVEVAPPVVRQDMVEAMRRAQQEGRF